MQIFWALHVSPPTEKKCALANRRSKVKLVLEYLSKRFLEVYHPDKNLSADESTVSFKGRLGFKVYNPKKPTKWGLRVYDIACAKTGYVLALIPYYGKATSEMLGNMQQKFNSRIIFKKWV